MMGNMGMRVWEATKNGPHLGPGERREPVGNSPEVSKVG